MKNSSINDNSIWPNGLMQDEDGRWTFNSLGENSHGIPTGITQFEGQEVWPEGDVLISPFVYKDGKLVGFCDTKALTVPTSTDPDSPDVKFDTLMPYDYIQVEFTSLTKDDIAIYAPRAKAVKVKWKGANDFVNLTSDELGGGSFKYARCTTATQVKAIDNYLEDIENGTWSQKLWALTDGAGLFGAQTSADANQDIETFNSDLTSLTKGGRMFENCRNLSTFNCDLSSLTSGLFMFENCFALSTFNCNDLSSLTDSHYMFEECKNLTTFSSDLKNMKYAVCMFDKCENLTSFNSDLRSLRTGYCMFRGCKLDTASIQNIAKTINNVENLVDTEYDTDGDGKISINGTNNVPLKQIDIGINNSEPNPEEEEAFNEMVLRGWTVYVNGKLYTPTSPAAITTLDETGEERITPIPFYAKPIPATEESADYVDENGNFFNIRGAQFIYGDDLSTYGMFTCEADAAANMRLTKIEKN